MLQHLSKEQFEKYFNVGRISYEPVHGESSVYYILALLCGFIKPNRVLEIGTCAGAGTVALARYTEPECRIFTVDITTGMNMKLNAGQENETLKPKEVGNLIDKYKFRDKVYQILGPSSLVDTLETTFDIIFIDGNHSIRNVTDDTVIAFRKHPQVIVWHDYQLDSVKKFIDELAEHVLLYLIDMPSVDNTKTVIWVNDEDFGGSEE